MFDLEETISRERKIAFVRGSTLKKHEPIAVFGSDFHRGLDYRFRSGLPISPSSVVRRALFESGWKLRESSFFEPFGCRREAV